MLVFQVKSKARDVIVIQLVVAHKAGLAQAVNGQAGALAQAAQIAILLMDGMAEAIHKQQHAAQQIMMLLLNLEIMVVLVALVPLL